MDRYPAFVAVSALLVVTPGADLLYVLGRGLAQGRRVALQSVAGLCAGYVGHTVLAVAGLAALVAASSAAFTVLRWAGAAYLVVLGLRLLRDRTALTPAGGAPAGGRRVVAQGVLTSLLNPKGLVLFVALLPQFTDPGAPVAPQLAVLGLTHVALCAVVYGAVGWASGSAGARLASRPRAATAIRVVAGSVLVALGGRLAADGAR